MAEPVSARSCGSATTSPSRSAPIASRRACSTAGCWSLWELSTQQTGRQTLELVYRLGTRQRGGGTGAAVKINAASREALMLAELWGADLQRVVWDAVLDSIEAAVQHAKGRTPGEPVLLRGFHASRDSFTVEVAVGAR